MRKYRGLLAIVAVVATAPMGVTAQPVTPREGQDYTLVVPPLPTDPTKLVVTEFFSYACPHCFTFAPALKAWEAKLPEGVALDRVAVGLGREVWVLPAQLFYALRALGKHLELDAAVFEALHRERVELATVRETVDWVARKGVDRAAFEAALGSFSVKSFVTRGDQLARSAELRGVPALVIDGKYRVQIDAAGDLAGQLRVVDALVAKAQAERRATR